MLTFGTRLFFLLLASCASAWAHVPYLERSDIDPRRPLRVADAEQSIAVYAWLHDARDVDAFSFRVDGATDLYLELIVPVCPGYESLLPWYALIGPGLPPPEFELPVPLPPGHGAIVVPNLAPGEPRDSFYEPFGGKSYYVGVPLRDTVSTPGRWSVVAWDPAGGTGDYVMVIGAREQFGPRDLLRAAINTPIIRQDGELHTDCPR
jgi:hypothetical protein